MDWALVDQCHVKRPVVTPGTEVRKEARPAPGSSVSHPGPAQLPKAPHSSSPCHAHPGGALGSLTPGKPPSRYATNPTAQLGRALSGDRPPSALSLAGSTQPSEPRPEAHSAHHPPPDQPSGCREGHSPVPGQGTHGLGHAGAPLCLGRPLGTQGGGETVAVDKRPGIQKMQGRQICPTTRYCGTASHGAQGDARAAR